MAVQNGGPVCESQSLPVHALSFLPHVTSAQTFIFLYLHKHGLYLNRTDPIGCIYYIPIAIRFFLPRLILGFSKAICYKSISVHEHSWKRIFTRASHLSRVNYLPFLHIIRMQLAFVKCQRCLGQDERQVKCSTGQHSWTSGQWPTTGNCLQNMSNMSTRLYFGIICRFYWVLYWNKMIYFYWQPCKIKRNNIEKKVVEMQIRLMTTFCLFWYKFGHHL